MRNQFYELLVIMTLFSVVLCLFFIVDFAKAASLPPKIIRDSDVTDPVIDAGANYTLTCEGSEPMKWHYPHPSEQKQKWTTFEVSTFDNPNEFNDYIYRSILHIRNISYPFVGYYTCQYDELGGDTDQIYLYVNDEEHLSVEDHYSLIYAIQYEETKIPCRPTAPDIQVALISYGDDDTDYEFNPETGFTFLKSHIGLEDTYFCSFKHPNQKQVEFPVSVKFSSARPFLPTPYIEDQSHNHTDVGETLNLTCFLDESSPNINFLWKTPRGTFKNAEHKNGRSKDVIVSSLKKISIGETNEKKMLISKIQIKNSTINDTGTYSCHVWDQQNNNSADTEIVVHDSQECFIEFQEENKQDSITVDANQPVQWILDVVAHPIPELIWYDNHDNVVKNNNVYHTEFVEGSKAMFKIQNALLENVGTYKVRGIAQRNYQSKSCPKQAEFKLKLNVNDKPSTCLVTTDGNCKFTDNTAPNIYLYQKDAELECKAKGNPLPSIIWEEKSCDDCEFKNIDAENKSSSDEAFTISGFLKIDTSRNGIIKCVALNPLGKTESILKYYISDVKDGFDLGNFDSSYIVNKEPPTTEVIVARNETFKFTCGICPKKSEELEVFFNEERLDERHSTTTLVNSLSNKTIVSLRYVQLADSGIYSCRIKNLHDDSYEYRKVKLTVKEPQNPTITRTNLHKDVMVDYPKMRKELRCYVTGIPKPLIEWYKGYQLIIPSKRVFLKDDNMTLTFNNTELSDEGIYQCKAFNSFGSVSAQATLRFKVKPISVIYYYITGSIAILLLAAITYIFIRVRKERQLRRELKLLGLENFHNGSPENLNPELGIDDQAELLPYNKKFEFSIEDLKIGKQLGSGAFGVVLKAEAKGIIQGESKSTVAVKMVKKNADQSYIKALASELKIMVHLGQHINVVNLLGACTKNVAKRELLVIVEFCRFGNLQNYIYKHRATYINQVDTHSGNIDYNIGADILERSYSVSSDNCASPVPSYSMQDYRERGHTMSTQLSTGDESVIMSNNSAQPEWRLNYRGDYGGDVKPISTRELLTWSFQVARGMDYLASRKVLHGDLAARNILLADNNVVKICDFGLAKTMYNDNNYKKKGNSPLPVKWMAIESIRDRVFSTQSDVWSFGIVLWEFFSLAKIPYPGMEADERLFHKLVDGYRMESPVYASRDIYNIMLDCWHSKPLARPSFTKLAEKIGVLLEDSVRKHYVDLNDPYLRMNTEKLEDNDYLAMLSPPSFDVLSTPTHYANSEMFAHAGSTGLRSPMPPTPDGYTHMGVKEIFSPRLEPDNIFNFPAGNRKEHRSESHELSPMLSRSDEELEKQTGYLTPITPINSVSNPIYHQMPTIENEKQPKTNGDIIKTSDNYISMPQYKNLMTNSFRDSGNVSPINLDLEKENSNVNSYYVNTDANTWKSVNV